LALRKPFDAILMFRMRVLQALNNLSDEQVEYQVRDRLSFSRFLGLAIAEHSGCHDVVAVPREAGQGWADRKAV
jgi:transposase, IS5 family